MTLRSELRQSEAFVGGLVVYLGVDLCDHDVEQVLPVLRQDAELDAALDAVLADALQNRRPITPALAGLLRSVNKQIYR